LPPFGTFVPHFGTIGPLENAVLKKIVLLAIPDVAPFEFGVICEVFGVDRSAMGGPRFDFSIATANPGRVRTNMGFDMIIEHDLSAAADADLIAVPAHSIGDYDPALIEVVRAAERRGAWVLSVCSGAFLLGAAGILDGRRSTTHWMYTSTLAADFPGTEVDRDVLFVDDRHVVTGAGTAAGIDAALHVVRTELGATAANIIARRMVVPPQRDGGQAQFIGNPIAECANDSFAAIADWMLEHLHEDLTVAQLARKALMSPRTFARRFRADMGATPAAWLNRQRLLRAQQLLEQGEDGLESIAASCGFGTAAVMRHHFVKTLQTTPTAYRRTFGPRAA
jgi:transcriptional regulator GlxA family with amidase domain